MAGTLFSRSVVAATLFALLPAAHADTLWFQGAEDGLTGISDYTSGSYPLIQSSVVAEGNYAFHIANPSIATEWFTVDPAASPLADSKLFFLSRLGWATTNQVATVQVSTNSGGSWNTLYSQPGDNGSGEGSFSLKSIDLSGYAGEDISLRFSMEFNSGNYFPQSSTDVGWLIDSLQIGDSLAKLQYDIGQPSDQEQLMLEYINRARADALVEADRLAALYDTDSRVRSAMDQYGVTKQSLVASFEDNVSTGALDQYAQPLAFHGILNEAAELHSQDMLDNNFQGHYSSSNPPSPYQPGYSPTQRVQSLGYAGGAAENVYAYAEDVPYGHAGFDIDWGVPSLGHRLSTHNNDYKEVGIGIVEGSNGGVGPMLITENFAPVGGAAFITGVVYEDLNGNNFYDLGEGRSGVQVDVEGSAYFAVSSDSGGYAVPVSADGTYDVSFSGAGWDNYLTTASVSGLENVKVDYLVSLPMGLAGDFDQNGVVDAADYTVWRDNATGEYTATDYDDWRYNYGATSTSTSPEAVPEPAAALLLCFAACGIAARHRQ